MCCGCGCEIGAGHGIATPWWRLSVHPPRGRIDAQATAALVRYTHDPLARQHERCCQCHSSTLRPWIGHSRDRPTWRGAGARCRRCHLYKAAGDHELSVRVLTGYCMPGPFSLGRGLSCQVVLVTLYITSCPAEVDFGQKESGPSDRPRYRLLCKRFFSACTSGQGRGCCRQGPAHRGPGGRRKR